MSALLHMFFAEAPLAAIALALALGYLVGKIRLGTFVLGRVAQPFSWRLLSAKWASEYRPK